MITKQELFDLYTQQKSKMGDKKFGIELKIHMPDDEIETIYNPNAHNKMKYINSAYNDNLVHQNSEQIYIVGAKFVV